MNAVQFSEDLQENYQIPLQIIRTGVCQEIEVIRINSWKSKLVQCSVHLNKEVLNFVSILCFVPFKN